MTFLMRERGTHWHVVQQCTDPQTHCKLARQMEVGNTRFLPPSPFLRLSLAKPLVNGIQFANGRETWVTGLQSL